jgi:hypothetical protein
MADTSVASARNFVARAEVAPAPRTRGAAAPAAAGLALETARNQAAVVGSDIISFVEGVTADRREAIINSSLLAQLVAKKKVAEATNLFAWYDAYFDTLANIGWVIQDKNFAEYREKSENFEAHQAILSVATTLLGAAPTALALVRTTLESLQQMNEDSPFLTIFERESRHARTARFQVTLADRDAGGQFFVMLMAFALEAKSAMTQVLFFRSKKNEAKLRHSSGKISINTTVLDGVGPAIKEKLADHAAAFVKQLPDL